MNIVTKRISQSFYAGTNLLGRKKDDIFLISYPKSGNTWVKFLLINVLINNKELKEDLSFKLVDETIPELGRDNLMKPWKFKSLPRFIKSHLAYKKVFFGNNKALLLVRNPKDVMVSYYHYVQSNYGRNFQGDFSEFIRSKKFGIETRILHQISWQTKATATIKFEDLKKDNASTLDTALKKLGVNIDEKTFIKSYEDASFNKMKELEKGPKRYNEHKPDYKFVRKGTSNQWRDYFNQNDLDYYNSLLEKYKGLYLNYYES